MTTPSTMKRTRPVTANTTKKTNERAKTTPKRRVGRPSSYTDRVGNYICQELMKGRTITKICKEEGMPHITTVFNWLNKLNGAFNEDFLKSYVQAREFQAEIFADQIKDIADDGSNDTYTITNSKTGKTEAFVAHDHIKRSVLRVEARKWLAAHLLPRKFSDKVQVTGAEGKDLIPPAPTQVIFQFVGEDEE